MSEFTPKSLTWSSEAVLQDIARRDFTISDKQVADLEGLFWNDLCSEHDAENICQYMENAGYKYNSSFSAFEKAWRRDEWNHYLGFRKIYSSLYGTPEEQLASRLASREVDFEPIREFLEDEFVFTLVLAYDEIATTKAYSMDHDLYRSFGDPRLHQWIRLVTRDEAFHFHNCMELIRLEHADRISEIPGHVNKFIQWDLGGHDYKGTFVLDHEGYYFTPNFLNDCGQRIVDYFERYPKSS